MSKVDDLVMNKLIIIKSWRGKFLVRGKDGVLYWCKKTVTFEIIRREVSTALNIVHMSLIRISLLFSFLLAFLALEKRATLIIIELIVTLFF